MKYISGFSLDSVIQRGATTATSRQQGVEMVCLSTVVVIHLSDCSERTDRFSNFNYLSSARDF